MSDFDFPDQFGRFRVDGLIGSGGMGEVYRAFDTLLGRVVALKVIKAGNVAVPELTERLHREARACAALHHPGIVTVHDIAEADGVLFIVMEFLTGRSLATVVDDPQIALDSKLDYLEQILEALEFAHQQGVLHRDIKPSNVHVLADGRSVKLLDFGIARLPSASSLTVSGAVMGTPFYASPEQLRGLDVDARSDVYSVGVLAYELLTGIRPFEGDTLTDLLLHVAQDPPPPIEAPWLTEYPELPAVIFKALSKSPHERFRSAGEMREVVQAIRRARVVAGTGAPYAPSMPEPFEGTVRVTSPYGESMNRPAGGSRAGDDRIGDDAISTTEQREPGRAKYGRGIGVVTAAIVLAASMIIAFLIYPGTRNRPNGPPVAPQSSQRPAEPPSDAGPTRPSGIRAGQSPPPGTTGDVAGTSGTSVNPAPDGGLRPIVTPGPTGPADPSRPRSGGSLLPGSAAPAADSAASVADLPEPADRPSARRLFQDGTSADGTAAAPANLGLRYRILKRVDGGELAVSPDEVFHSGDRIRISVQPNMDGYLYVFQQGSTGRWSALFPSAQVSGATNNVSRLTEYVVPAGAVYRFDNNPGVEHVFVYLSRHPIEELRPVEPPSGPTLLAQFDAGVIEDVRGRLRSRDLVLETAEVEATSARPDNALSHILETYVVNRQRSGEAVTVTIDLKHQ